MPKDAASDTVFVRARIPTDAKARGDEILRREGLSQQKAIELFWRAMVERDGFPWEIKASRAKSDA